MSEHGHVYPWNDIKAAKKGGDVRDVPPARCTICGELRRPESPMKAKFRAVVREILAEGRVPFPTELNVRMGWNGGRAISGHYVPIRTQELLAHGYVRDEKRNKWVRS